MGRPKKLQTETIPENQIVTKIVDNYSDLSNQLIQFQATPVYEELSEMDRILNDNVSTLKDGEILNAIMNYSGANDKEKIMFLFLKFRQQERERMGA